MLGIGRYVHWLHTRWPAGTVEKLPDVNEDGTTSVPGLRVVGDLTGIPLLKFSAHTGATAVQAIASEESFRVRKKSDDVADIAIVGGGVSGVAAAIEAKAQGLRYVIFESAEPFHTIVNFPKAKPIYTYPTEMDPAGQMKVSADVKEALLEELEAQRKEHGVTAEQAHVERIERKGDVLLVHAKADEKSRVQKAHRVILAIGRSGNYRRLGVPGEDLDKVYHRLYDPMDYSGKDVLVVGGGDSALETSIALALSGARVTLSYRKAELSRPKPENVQKLEQLARDPRARVSIERPVSERVNTSADWDMLKSVERGSITMLLGTDVEEIREDAVLLRDKLHGERDTPYAGDDGSGSIELKNDVVFAMIGREAPLDFFRRSGVPIRGEWRAATWVSFVLFFAFCSFVYVWKKGGDLTGVFRDNNWFPFNVPGFLRSLTAAADDPSTFVGTMKITLEEPGFYYSLVYTIVIVVFGVRRIRRRKTPYITAQTVSLIVFQVLPLFLLPYILLPWLGHNGVFDAGFGKTFADNLFPEAGYGHGREYWRSFGFILAWPLFLWNFFTSQPLTWWLVIGCVQTFVIIPLMMWRWGKGAYCGWICSCGGLAETLGDTQRHKMPHGPFWNRLNMVGQGILWFAVLLMIARVASWISPRSWYGRPLGKFFQYGFTDLELLGIPLNYNYVVDLFLAGIVGVGLYFWFSGRVWCRFFCPLAALMHLYTRAFSRFRIFADKKKCISCNQCTSVCHQGIDIMNFANKGQPMEDPECVRCSACVHVCPTGTLTFGRLGKDGPVLDRLAASPVQMTEGKRARSLPIVN